MKPLLFKCLLLMLITSTSVYAQKKQIYSKSFDVNTQTTAIFNLDDSAVVIESSDDDKVYLDYAIEFDGFSNKEIDSLFEMIKVDAFIYDNRITLKANNIVKSHQYFTYKGTGSLFTDNLLKSKKINNKDPIIRKSQDSILREVRAKNKVKPLDSIGNRFRIKEKDGTIKSLKELGGVKATKGQFVIKIPPYVKLTINAKVGYLTFIGDIKNELSVSLKRGKLKAQQLTNAYNQFKIEDAGFEVEELKNGDYTLNNISNGLIGGVNNAKITSEFSKIEIGEIAGGVTIVDFKSDYWFYNWSTDFKRFDLYSQYSRIHYFYPEADYSLKVIGNNTINDLGKVKINMQPTSTGQKFNMMERKPNSKSDFSGHINFDIVHGIIYSYNDTFILNKD